MNVQSFRKVVWAHYKKQGRHTLPWRNLPAGRQGQNAYKILVSEVMLQQTQVERVIPSYTEFLQKFPTVKALAEASLADVLRAWQGLGYNRRAQMLQRAAKEIIARHKGVMPRDLSALEALSGVGPYTARAIAAFAFNRDVIFVETNIRTVITHHFFTKKNTTIYRSVSDRDIEKILEKALPKGRAREWYSALMDYGSYLKRSGISTNARSAHYIKQSKFTGSLREARGAILRALTLRDASRANLLKLLGMPRRAQIVSALSSLEKEGLVEVKGARYTLAT